jgi:hypothetical protein
MVATPLYDGAQSAYLRSVLGLLGTAQGRGVSCAFTFIGNNASIALVRDLLVGAFLGSGATHLVLIDGDIGFVPDEVLDLVARMAGDESLAVVGAPCPKRQVNWQTVDAAARAGLGAADPRALELYSGLFTLELLEPAAQVRLDQPVEVGRIGTGLMAIRRDVILDLYERHGELRFTPQPQDRIAGMIEGDLRALFHPFIEPDTGQLLSEDYAFCHRARAAGHRIWAAPWMRTSHTGPAVFGGTVGDLARLQAATAPARS